MSWQDELTQLLKAYIGQEDVQDGAAEMASVAAGDDDHHKSQFLAPLDAAISAAAAGDESVVRIIYDTQSWDVSTPDEARVFLERLREAYVTRYEELSRT